MPGSIKIGIIGGDERAVVIAARLCKHYECAVWGLDAVPEGCVKCVELSSALRGADAVILPLPVSRGGKMLNCRQEISLYEISALIGRGTLVCGGMIPVSFREAVHERGGEIFDYYDEESVQIKNAVPTAEGTIAAIISEMPITVSGMRIAVTGYGRCASTIVRRLILLGAEVYVAARSEKDRAWAEVDGASALPLGQYLDFPVLCDAVVNTVPIKLFDESVLERLGEGTAIFDISGGCVGTDKDAAERCGVRVIPLPALPGKTSPVTAGNIIASALMRRLGEYLPKGGD